MEETIVEEKVIEKIEKSDLRGKTVVINDSPKSINVK